MSRNPFREIEAREREQFRGRRDHCAACGKRLPHDVDSRFVVDVGVEVHWPPCNPKAKEMTG